MAAPGGRVMLATIIIAAVALGAATATHADHAATMIIPEAHAQIQAGGVDKEGSWYAGEGLKQGDYFSYSMCHFEYMECAKFGMDIWIKGDIQTGSETKWLAEAVVYDGNKIMRGNIELGKVIAPEPTGGSDEIITYRNAFKSSIVWLSAFATADSRQEGKGPKEFTATSWGKIGNIGGEQVVPLAIEDVKAAGKTWETVRIGWKTGGYNSNVWVADDFPFPIKAKTYVHVSEGIPPVEYEFVLLDYKEDVQENPFAGITPTNTLESAKGCGTGFDKDTAIKKSTVNAMYQIHVFYGPEDPRQHCTMEWNISFIKWSDETEFLNQVQFDIWTINENNERIRSLASEAGRQFLYSASGQYQIEIPIYEEPGDADYVIWVYGIAPDNIVPSDHDDYVKIPITIYENTFMAEQDDGAAGGMDQVDEPPPSSPPSDTASSIPSWIKSNAGWWADGTIDDASFVSGIQYLIGQGIIQIPPTDVDNAGGTPSEIPSWIKSNAGWWADGTIDDGTFVLAIQFLIKNGIMVIA